MFLICHYLSRLPHFCCAVLMLMLILVEMWGVLSWGLQSTQSLEDVPGEQYSHKQLCFTSTDKTSQFLYYVVNWLMTLCETLLCVFTPAQQVQCYDTLAKTESWTIPGLMYVYSSSTFWMSYVSWQYNIAEMPFKTKLGQKYKVLHVLHCNQ